MKKYKLLKIHWFKVLAMLFFVLLFGVYSNVFAAPTPGEIIDSNCSKGDVICVLKTSTINTTISIGNFLQSTSTSLASGWSAFTYGILNNGIDGVNADKQFATSLSSKIKSTYIASKQLGLNTTASVGDSLTSVGNFLTSISDSLASGWSAFTYGLLNNITDSVNGTKEFAVSVGNGAKLIGNGIAEGWTSTENFVTSLFDKKTNSLVVAPIIKTPTPITSIPPPVVTTPTPPIPTSVEIIPVPQQIIQSGLTGQMGPRGLTGLQGPRGEAGRDGNIVDTSSFVSRTFLDKQVNGIFDSISNSTQGLSSSLSEEVITKLLTVSGDATIGGNITITGNITGHVAGTINPSFTLGSIPFQGATGLAEDNANLFWDATNSRLGIGTRSPSSLLQVGGNGGADGSFDVQANLGDSWFSVAGGSIKFNEEGGSTTAGNVNLGARFNISPVNDSLPALAIRGVTAGVSDLLRISSPSSTTGNYFIIKSDGNVGIGTTTPGALLDLQKNNIGSTSALGLRLINTTAATSGQQQYSPSIILRGNSWVTNVSHTEDWKIENQTVGWGEYSYFSISNSANGGPYTNMFQLRSDGTLTTPLQMDRATNDQNNYDAWISLVNYAAATVSSDSYSPLTKYIGNGWKTAAPAGSERMTLSFLGVAPEQGVTHPIGVAKWVYGTNTLNAAPETNELMRFEWGDRLGVVFNKTNIAGYQVAINGNVGIGTTSPYWPLTVGSNKFGVTSDGEVTATHTFGLAGTDENYPTISGYTYSNTQWHALRFAALRTRGTKASQTAVVSGDYMMLFDNWGHDGTTTVNGASFGSFVDGTVSTGIVPMKWEWSTMNTSGVKDARLTIKSSGNVGIGTPTPAYKLDVNGAINATSVLINGVAVGAGGTQWASGSGGIISYTGGNVGIGTPSPGYGLDVETGSIKINNNITGAGSSGTIYLGDGSFTKAFGGSWTFDGGINNTNGSIISTYNNANSALVVTQQGSGSAGTFMGGNVGIGTTTPGAKLDVAGLNTATANNTALTGVNFSTTSNYGAYTGIDDVIARITETNATQIGLVIKQAAATTVNPFEIRDSTNTMIMRITSSGAIAVPNVYSPNGTNSFGLGNGTDMKFTTNAVERMRILYSNGYVGIGTTSPNQLLSLVKTSGGGTTTGLELANFSATNNSGIGINFNFDGGGTGVANTHAFINAVRSNAVSSNDTYLSFGTRGGGTLAAERMRIDPTGNVGIGTNTPSGLLTVNQTTTTGGALVVTRNLDAVSTDSSLVSFNQQNSADDQNALTINNVGTGTGLNITQAGTHRGLYVYSNVDATATYVLADFNANNAAFTQNVLNITNAGTGRGLNIAQNGTGYGFFATSGSASANSALGKFTATNAAFNQSVLNVTNAGTAEALYISNAGTGTGLRIDQGTTGTGRGLYVYSNVDATAINVLADFSASNATFTKSVLNVTNNGTGNGLNINQNGPGYGLYAITNGGAATSGLGRFVATNAAFDKYVLSISNAGTSTALDISQSGNGFGLNVYSNVGSGTFSLALFQANNVAFSSNVVSISNAGTGNTLNVYSSNTGTLANLYSTGAVTTPKGMYIHADNASGVITDALDVSDPEIVNALNVGANTITGAGYLVTSTASGLTINSTSANLALQTTTSGDITLIPGGTGKVGIGNTSPQQKLDVTGTIRQSGCIVAGTLSANTSGDIICTSSSIRFKNTRTNLTDGLQILTQLQPVSYIFNDNMNLGKEIHYGFISEEVNSVNQALATHDATGAPYGLDSTAILAVTVNAIKELNLKVNDLSSLDTTSETSLGSLIKNFLADVTNGITDLYASVIHSDRVETKTLCVGDTCVTEEQFLEMVNNNISNPVTSETPTPPATDMCPNIEGTQKTVPDGMEVDDAGDCVAIVTPPTDICPNIEGNQETVPDGMEVDSAGDCVAIVTPPAEPI